MFTKMINRYKAFVSARYAGSSANEDMYMTKLVRKITGISKL